MSEILGRKVEMGIFSRSMGVNLSTVGGGMRALRTIILYMWCNFAWLSDLTSLTEVELDMALTYFTYYLKNNFVRESDI